MTTFRTTPEQLGPFAVGDRPSASIDADIETDYPLDGYSTAAAKITDPQGVVIWSADNAILDDSFSFMLPRTGLTTPGVYDLTVFLTAPNDVQLRLPSHRFVVQALDGWHNLDSARAVWSGAPNDDPTLYELLEVAKGQVLAYAPATVPETIPLNYRRAQYMQARNIWNAAVKDSGESFGGEGFAVTVFPMDWSVKNLIRPKRGVPVVG